MAHDIKKAIKFFEKYAGQSWPSGAGPAEKRREKHLGALALARAEAWLDEHSDRIAVIWEEDPDAETEYPKEVLSCFLVLFPPDYIDSLGYGREPSVSDVRPAGGEILASLHGIGDPGRNYGRVVAAELALEVMETAIEANRRNTRRKRGSR